MHLLLRRAREEREAIDRAGALVVIEAGDERFHPRRIEDRARLPHAHAGGGQPDVDAAPILTYANENGAA